MPDATTLARAAEWQAPHTGIGSNSGANLAEVLAEESAALAARAADLAAAAGRAAVTDEDTAGKATILAKMMRDHLKAIDDAREQSKRPYLEAGRTVDAHYSSIAGTLATFDAKKKPIGGPLCDVLTMIDGYRREQERLAEIERQRLAEEARKAREEAAAAERARQEAEREAARQAEEARKAGDREAAARAEAEAAQQRLAAEIAQREASERAAELDRQASETRAAPIDTGLGVKASSRTTYQGTIVDFDKAIRWAVKLDRPAILAAVQAVVDRQVRAKNHTIPGVEVKPVTSTVIR